MTAITAKVVLDSEEAIDAVAALEAAGNVLSALNGFVEYDLSTFFWEQATKLQEEAFGDAWRDEGHPATVEIQARADEKAAAALGALRKPDPVERALSDDDHYEITKRRERWLRDAEIMRRLQTVDPQPV